MTELEIDTFGSLTLAIIVYFAGARLTRRVAFLRNFNIPEPVSGGIFASLVTLVLVWAFDLRISFDLAARDIFLVYFFTGIGLNAKFEDLLRGGRPLALLLILTVGFMVLQNVIGVAGTTLLGLPDAVGVLVGSASLIGGHGTAVAWSPTIAETYGIANAAEIGIASATFGLIAGSLLGGPIAKYLLVRDRLQAAPRETSSVGLAYEEETEAVITANSLMATILALHIAIILGYTLNESLEAAGFKLPLFVSCLLCAPATQVWGRGAAPYW